MTDKDKPLNLVDLSDMGDCLDPEKDGANPQDLADAADHVKTTDHGTYRLMQGTEEAWDYIIFGKKGNIAFGAKAYFNRQLTPFGIPMYMAIIRVRGAVDPEAVDKPLGDIGAAIAAQTCGKIDWASVNAHRASLNCIVAGADVDVNAWLDKTLIEDDPEKSIFHVFGGVYKELRSVCDEMEITEEVLRGILTENIRTSLKIFLAGAGSTGTVTPIDKNKLN